MRKSVFPRIMLLILLYCSIFIIIVTIQFARQTGFTQRVGGFVISGQQRLPGEYEPPLEENEFLLDGNANVFFGGMNFGLTQGNNGHSLHLISTDGTIEHILPERLIVYDNSAFFIFPDGTKLEFASQHLGGAAGLRISAAFSGGTTGIELPFSPSRRTRISGITDGYLLATVNGVNYSFGHSPVDIERGKLLIMAGGAPISYRAILDRRPFMLEDFILAQAQTAQAYSENLNRWLDHNFSLWSNAVSGQNNEDIVVAFITEAFARGNYRAAVAAVPQSFLRSPARTYQSSVFLGGLSQAAPALIASERQRLSRLSRQINEMSLEFLIEPRVFNYFAVRGHTNYIDAAANLVRTIDPPVLALDLVPGIFEGYTDWRTIRGAAAENPFERLIQQAFFVVSEFLQISPDASQVFVYGMGGNNAEFNLRLGMALLSYEEAKNRASSAWAGVGRSLILTALSADETAGARLYRILNPRAVHPRAVPIALSPANNIWAWTAAETVSVTQQNDELNITVTFPAGESHFMIIRGVRPFVRLQLYNTDWRTAPLFETYDSSGWVYIAAEQTLIVKKRHRSTAETIRIIYREDPPPPPPPPSPPPAEVTGGTASPGETTQGGTTSPWTFP